MLTKTQIKRLQKAKNNGTGSDIKISKTRIRKAIKQGRSLWSSSFSLGTKMLPHATKAVTKAVPALATGALTGLADLGVSKLFGKGQSGGFLIPQNKIEQLTKYKDWLTEAQKKQMVNAIHTGGQVIIKPTKSQSGGFLGTLLASIGIPMLIDVLTGKGLQVDKTRPRRSVPVYVPSTTTKNSVPVYVPTTTTKKDGGLVLPVGYRSPPFFGTWDQYGKGLKPKKKTVKKIKTGKGLLLGKNSPFKNVPLLNILL